MIVYEAFRGNERVRGSIDEVSAAIGRKPKYVRKMVAGIRGARNGWKVRRLYCTQWVYAADNPDDDPVSGPLEEVASILGYTQRYIRLLADTGRVSKDGWRVKKHIAEVSYDV